MHSHEQAWECIPPTHRRIEGGRFTSWIFDSLKEGHLLNARGPLGSFTLRSDPQTPLLFVAGGTGLAPILSLLRQTVAQHPEHKSAFAIATWRNLESGLHVIRKHEN